MRRILSALLMIAIILSTLAMTTACDEEGETTSVNLVQENSQQNTTSSGDDDSANEVPLLVDAEIINGKLILFYSDGTTKESNITIDLGESAENSAKLPISASCLNFYPLSDSNYGVSMQLDRYTGEAINPHLQELTIPSTYNGVPVTTILPKAFSGISLEMVTIPEGIVEISREAFSSVLSNNIVLPDSLRVIGYRAFAGCAFTEITIPHGVTKIDSHAFTNCRYLTNVTYEGTKEEWEGIVDSFSFGIADGYPYSYSCTIHCSDGDIVVEP